MPNIATALKSEISRIARKEVKADVAALKKNAIAHRKEIAALKRRASELEQLIHRSIKTTAQSERAPVKRPSVEGLRYSGKGLASHRKRLGLSASEVALLLGTSGQTIYNWEQGKSRPHATHLPAIAALRTLGKKDAAAVIAARSGQDESVTPAAA